MMFWTGWPLIWLYLIRSKRTRVVILSGGDVLLVRSWVGSGGWILPGGGVRKREESLTGAIRETREETGIELKPESLQLFDEGRISDSGLSFGYVAYSVKLSTRPQIHSQRPEIIAAEWMPLGEALTSPQVSRATRQILSSYRAKITNG